MNVHRQASIVCVHAPAKLNLFFELLARRSDGFHEVETLMLPISLYDTLLACPTSADAAHPHAESSAGQIQLECCWAYPDARQDDSPGIATLGALPPANSNLVTRAVELLRAESRTQHGIRLRLIKRIPSAAGLGGGSSDAAAALLAANAVWQLGWTREQLLPLAAQLGSDVPFFLAGGAAICTGRGECIEPVAGLGNLHFVVVRPPEGLATAAVYGRCRVPAEPLRVAPLVQALRRGEQRALKHLLHNRLEPAAESLTPWVARLRDELAGQDCLADQMSGSGTAYFGLCRNARHARRVAQRLRARGVGRVYAASASN